MFQYTTPTHLEGKYWTKLSVTPAVLGILRQPAVMALHTCIMTADNVSQTAYLQTQRFWAQVEEDKLAEAIYWMERQVKAAHWHCSPGTEHQLFQGVLFSHVHIWNSLLLVLAFGFLLFSITQFTLQIIWEGEVCPNLVLCQCSMVTADLKRVSDSCAKIQLINLNSNNQRTR